MKLTRIIISGLLMVLLAACVPTTPVPTEEAADEPTEEPTAEPTEQEATGEPTEEPTAEPTPEPTAELTPVVEAQTQLLSDEGTVTVPRVVAAQPGWLVIHADEGGAPGPVIGQTQVAVGENTDVTVEVDDTTATDTLYAMLHVDDGEEGAFEFPEGDPPVTDADGDVVVAPFELGEPIDPVVEAISQDIENGTVTVARVVSPGPGWIVIHAAQAGAPGPVIGQAQVPTGESTSVEVNIDSEAATDTLFAMLHRDSGEAGEFEFPEADSPIRDAQGDVVVTPFVVGGAGEPTLQPAVSVGNQLISEEGTVTIPSVAATQLGWVVIHADEGGAPGPVIGQAQVAEGENNDVVVEVDEAAATDTLYAMLHVDDGVEGTFEFPGGDAPVTNTEGDIVVQAFELAEPITPVLEVNTQSLEDGTVTIARVVSPGPGWITIRLPQAGTPGEVIGQAQVEEGENTDVVVEIATENVGQTLFAALHTDDGEVGTFEFPDGDQPVLNEQGDAVVEPFVIR